MRYHPKIVKLFFLTKFNKNLILNQATMKEVIQPIIRKISSLVVKANPVLSKSKDEAANIVGIANKKENSTIAEREIPKDNPPIIVAADLETPGIIARA